MNTPHYLHDGAIMLRCPEPYDLDIIYSWENDTELWTEGSANAPFTRKIIEEYIDNYNPDIYSARQLRLMIVKIDTMETIGAADLYEFDPHNRRAGVGIIIDRRFQRMGYGARALTLLSEYSRDMLGMHQLYATIAVDNEASLRLFQKSEFKICGRYRSWVRRGAHYVDVFALQRLFT